MFRDWDENKGSAGPAYFQFGVFDVTEAKQILKAAPDSPRDWVDLEVADYKAMLKMVSGVGSASIEIDCEVPLIAVKVNGGNLPIDGWGRIAKAIERGRSTLRAVVLTKEEKQRIQRA